jgi:hypothetical protein
MNSFKRLISFVILIVINAYLCAINNSLIIKTIPKSNGVVYLNKTLIVNGTVDFNFVEYQLVQDCLEQLEGQTTVIKVLDGGHVKNLIVGKNAGNGIVCMGNCILENVHWRDVCEVFLLRVINHIYAYILSNNLLF